jgi:hypothetical protein
MPPKKRLVSLAVDDAFDRLCDREHPLRDANQGIPAGGHDGV